MAARGRVEPKNGVLRIAGPSDFVVVVGRLEVGEGDRVKAGQVLALTDAYGLREARSQALRTQIATLGATILRLRAELENARVEEHRVRRLSEQGIVTDRDRDAAETRRKVAEASLAETNRRFDVQPLWLGVPLAGREERPACRERGGAGEAAARGVLRGAQGRSGRARPGSAADAMLRGRSS